MRAKDNATVKKQGKVMKMPVGKPPSTLKKRAASTAKGKPPAPPASLKAARAAASRNKALSRVTALFFCLVFAYIFRGVVSFAFKPHIAIDRITTGSVTSPVDLAGVAIRHEKVYKSAASGSLRFNVAENKRVKKGEAVCSIQDAEEVDRINAELMDVNEELLKIQALRGDASPELGASERRVNLMMKNMLDDWAGKAKIGDYAALYALKGSLESNVEIRNQIILSGVSDALREQSDKRQMYQDELSRHMTVVTAGETGIVSSLLDGYEETYTLNIMAKLSKEQTVLKNAAAKIVAVKAAEPETPVFKIIHSNIWYVAAYLPNGLIEGWEENDPKTLHIEPHAALPVSVGRIAHDSGESYVLFKCTRRMEEFLGSRQLRFRVSDEVNEGLKIPRSAIVSKTLVCVPKEFVAIDDDQLKWAKIVKPGGETVPLHYTALDDGTVYFDPANGQVTLGMEIQNPANGEERAQLSEMADIIGVYRVNNGTADFRKVSLEDEQMAAGYYILDPSLNKGLRERDSIVRNASEVAEGQIIY